MNLQKRAMTTQSVLSEEEEQKEERKSKKGVERKESGVRVKRKGIKYSRKYSDSLLKLVLEFNPRLEEQCQGSDITCLLAFLELNIANFENSDLDKFQKQLEQLTSIFNHLIPSPSYLRNTLVKVTGLFKNYWVKRGELEKPEKSSDGRHLFLVRKTVRAPKALVMEYISQRMDRQSEKLKNRTRNRGPRLNKTLVI